MGKINKNTIATKFRQRKILHVKDLTINQFSCEPFEEYHFFFFDLATAKLWIGRSARPEKIQLLRNFAYK